MAATFIKDPDAILDYGIDWSRWLASDTISSSTWTLDAGITKVTDSHDTQTTTIVLSGGVLDQTYHLTNRITTAAGHTNDQSIQILIAQK